MCSCAGRRDDRKTNQSLSTPRNVLGLVAANSMPLILSMSHDRALAMRRLRGRQKLALARPRLDCRARAGV
jgi:hypothetical protein